MRLSSVPPRPLARRAPLLALPLALLACERRVLEPAPPASATSVPLASPAAPGAARPAGPAHAARSGPKCVVALPDRAPPPARPGPDPACPRDPAGGPPMVPAGHVRFPEAPSAPPLEVELMLTEAHQERGLMYRKHLDDDRGMLFVFPGESVHTFWMHHTCIPLDMLFVDAEGYVAGVVEHAPTLDDGGRSVPCPVKYVLEVNAGWARRHGVTPGQRLAIDGVPAR